MTKVEAINKAKRLARERQDTVYVVFEDGYHVADGYDLDTFFLGTEPIACIDSTGTVS